MDRDEAKLLLCNYRPNGADIADEKLQEALQLTLIDQELGQWFAESRSFDSLFSEALYSIDVPQCVKQHSKLPVKSSDKKEGIDLIPEDEFMIDSLALIQPPKQLKTTILSAVAVQQKHPKSYKEGNALQVGFRKLLYPLSVAAVIIISIHLGGLMSKVDKSPKLALESHSLLIDLDKAFQKGDLQTSNKPLGHLKNASFNRDSHSLVELTELPTYLKTQTIIGCKPLLVDGESATLMCFDSKDYGVLHLVVYHSSQTEQKYANLPPLAKVKGGCKKCCKTGFSVAKWKNNNCVCVLFSRSLEVQKLESVF